MDFEALQLNNHSTAIAGNTLALMETKVLLEDKLSICGKDIREIYEVVTYNNMYAYIKTCITEAKALRKTIVKEIYAKKYYDQRHLAQCRRIYLRCKTYPTFSIGNV